MDTCAPFEGNADLYGLGIRLGVYLQWISAWISLLLDPHSAQSIYDTNSVSVFAIMVATIIAAQFGTAAVEIHIMLQFMLGSFITVLSTLGVRLWLMSPDRLAKLETTTTAVLKSVWALEKARLGRLLREPWRDLAQWGMITFLLPMAFLNILSALKPPGLSWSGVTWRTGTAAVVAAYNLAFWFDNSGSGAQQPPREGCGPPYIFLLSKQQLTGPVITLCRFAAVIIATAVFPATLLLCNLTAQLFCRTTSFSFST
ncbi:hypothetical protein N7447_009584 [Penicillium robsamsonii]|uniref:uncharacterized protein n=1 Tax=Penicillium robsamsonii TaxID=1792511 RepID=UPI002548158D|nr:uncharacterized protein N7447_009584 [Penicillium robsamsonii]KAJ5817351.1 hypothetical protein N7447_009584 [Penicillium robsamsonii]